MDSSRQINVIVPLKLDWEPFYLLDDGEDVSVGDRVAVPFAGRSYIAVVSAVGGELPSGMDRSCLKPIFSIHRELRRILPSEIEFWRKVAGYYMCTVGEVYRMACPSGKEKPPRGTDVFPEMHFSTTQPPVGKSSVEFIDAPDEEKRLLELCGATEGNVLWLVPEKKFTKAMCGTLSGVLGDRLVIWDSLSSPAKRFAVLKRMYSGEGYVLLGNRSSLFLPFTNLSLVVVQQENDPSYKVSSLAPRINGRDCAVMLASLHGARTVLTSRTPSLETVYNCMTGKYKTVCVKSPDAFPPVEVVDTKAEVRKNGMVGDISRRMIASFKGLKVAFFKPRRAIFPKMDDLLPQLHNVFGDDAFLSDDLVESPLPAATEAVGVFGADDLLSKADFRADERALQILRNAIFSCDDNLRKVVVQTREAAHPVFSCLESGDVSPLLDERRLFFLPPYSRIVDIIVRDSFPDRAARMSRLLMERTAHLSICPVMQSSSQSSETSISVLRLALPRDKTLSDRKTKLQSIVAAFEKENKYVSRISFDVDPE